MRRRTVTTTDDNSSFECSLDGASFASCTSPKSYMGLADGSHTFEVRALNSADTDATPASRTRTVDSTAAPKVDTVTPTSGATGVVRTTTVTASFSEDMDPTTLTAKPFTLTKQGSTTPVTAMVSHDATTNRVTLAPSSALAASTKRLRQ